MTPLLHPKNQFFTKSELISCVLCIFSYWLRKLNCQTRLRYFSFFYNLQMFRLANIQDWFAEQNTLCFDFASVCDCKFVVPLHDVLMDCVCEYVCVSGWVWVCCVCECVDDDEHDAPVAAPHDTTTVSYTYQLSGHSILPKWCVTRPQPNPWFATCKCYSFRCCTVLIVLNLRYCSVPFIGLWIR